MRIVQFWPITFTTYLDVVSVPSVASPLLAATIPNHECEIFDGFYDDSIKRLKEKIRNFDIIAVNGSDCITILNVILNIKLIKEINPKAKIIIGGHNATFYHTQWIKEGADFVVRHEGEITFPLLIEAIEKNKNFKEIKGLTYRSNGEIIVNSERPFLKDLDESPLPRWELVDFSKYHFFFNKDGLTASMEISRGCFHKCIFCAPSIMWKKTQRFKSVDRVLGELHQLKTLGVKNIYFVDDNFAGDVERYREIFKRMINERIEIDWFCYIRADTIYNNPDLVKLAAQAGFKIAYVGYESFQKTIIEHYNKKYNLQNQPYYDLKFYEKVFNICQENNIFVIGSFLIDNSYKDINDIRRDIKALRKYSNFLRIFCFKDPTADFWPHWPVRYSYILQTYNYKLLFEFDTLHRLFRGKGLEKKFYVDFYKQATKYTLYPRKKILFNLFAKKGYSESKYRKKFIDSDFVKQL